MIPPLVVIPLALLLSGPRTQSPQPPAPRDARAASRATAVLSGVVVSDDADARPVRRVRVTCGADAGHGLTAVTDDQGRFVFPNLPAGRYTVLATRAGWVNAAYGAKRPMRPGTAIPVADGEKTEIVVRMLRGAVITGTILDQNNEPAASAIVNAMRNSMQNGERRLLSYATSRTDDRGVYRIFGLPPGDYVVGVPSAGGFFNARTGELRLMTDAVRRDAQADAPGAPPAFRTVALASTYFPGSATATEASVVTLRAGEERSGVDFSLRLVATARVEGIVTSPDGTPPSRVLLSLLSSGQNVFPSVPFDGYRTGSVGPDGSFSLSNVSPGQYTLLARTTLPALASDGLTPSPGPRIVWASAEVSVDGDNVTGISLSLQPGMTLAGQVRFDGTTVAPPASFANVRVSLVPVHTTGAATLTPNPVRAQPDGRFLLSGITPGQYRLAASFPGAGRPGGWMLRSALVNGQDAIDVPLAVQPGQNVAGATITFTNLPAQLTGTLLHAGGSAATDYTIVLFPADQAFWTPQSRRIQGVRPSADGTFAFANLPAGAYRLAAVDDIETSEWFDPSVLQRLLPTTIAVTIGEGEHKVQNVQIGGTATYALPPDIQPRF